MADNGQFLTSTGAKNFFPSRARGSNNNFPNNKNIHIAQMHDEEPSAANSTKADNRNPNPDGDPEKTFSLWDCASYLWPSRGSWQLCAQRTARAHHHD